MQKYTSGNILVSPRVYKKMIAELLIYLLFVNVVLSGGPPLNGDQHIKKILRAVTDSSANFIVKNKKTRTKEVSKMTVFIGSHCHWVDQEFGPQARQAPLRRPDPQSLSRLLRNHHNSHSQWVMTGYGLRVGPPQANEKNAQARAEELQRILDRRHLPS